MFLSFEQIVILLLLAFILFGPERLPEIAAKLGRMIAKLREASNEVTQQFHEPLRTIYEPPQIPKDSTCPQCQQPLEQDFAFCPHCGHRLKPDSSHLAS